MKAIIALSLLFSLNISMAKTQCEKPLGVYTDLEMVLNQFVFNNGNPNWGDWCYELDTGEDGLLCTNELNLWDNFLDCQTLRFEKSCQKWADKEGFATTKKEYDDFVSRCVVENFKMLLE